MSLGFFHATAVFQLAKFGHGSAYYRGMKRTVKSGLILALAALGLTAIGLSAEHTQKMSKKEVNGLIANANSRADHEKLAAYYHGEAARLKAEQQDHEEERAEYNKHSMNYPSKYPTMGDHCGGLAGYYGLAAKKAQALAEMHESIAKDAK